MDFRVLITDTALADLRGIVEFIADDDPQAAARLGEKLVTRVLSLASSPERYAYADARRMVRKMPLQPYLVFYTCDISARVVNILHFWHGAQRQPDFP